jgi:hypothetical protein
VLQPLAASRRGRGRRAHRNGHARERLGIAPFLFERPGRRVKDFSNRDGLEQRAAPCTWRRRGHRGRGSKAQGRQADNGSLSRSRTEPSRKAGSLAGARSREDSSCLIMAHQ